MASLAFFIILAIIIIILLIMISVFSTKGAIDVFASSNYGTDTNLKSAHQKLIIASSIGWISFVILLIVLIISYALGAFILINIASMIKNKGNPTSSDLTAAYKGEKELSKAQSVGLILIIFLVLISLIVFLIGILCASAAVSINRSPNIVQSIVKSAYNSSVIGAVLGIVFVLLMIVTLVAYVFIRNSLRTEEKELEEITKGKID